MTLVDFALWYGVLTGTASLIGLAVAAFQIRNAKTAAETANTTARRVERQLAKRSVLYEVSSCGQAVADARNYLRLGLAQSAQFRTETLASRLSTIRRLEWFQDEQRGEELRAALYSVSLVRTALDDHLCKNPNVGLPPNTAKTAVNRMGKVEDQLNEWIGELRHTPEEGQE